MKFRHEIKHVINLFDYIIISNKLKHIMKKDPNSNESGEYKIRSLYFDNHNDKVLKEKIDGINSRDKYRIRLYNDDPSFIRLEKKSKINGLCQKSSSKISKEEVELLLSGHIEFLKNSTNLLFNELFQKMTTEFLKPKTIVDYTRESYIYAPGNVRITFDKSIKSGLNSIDILSLNLPTIETLDSKFIVMEIKYDEFIPEIIADLVQIKERKASSISKYALCRMYN